MLNLPRPSHQGIPNTIVERAAETERHSSGMRKLLLAGLIAGVALIGANGISDQITEASAESAPIALTAKKHKKCEKQSQVKLKLVQLPGKTPAGRSKFRIDAKTCHKTRPKLLKKVKLLEIGEQGQKKTWKLKKFPPHTKKSRKFNLDTTPKTDPYGYDDGIQTIILKAVDRRGHRIGSRRYELRRSPTGEIAINHPKAATCRPRPDFEVGIQDDDQFVFQKKISRTRAFELAESEFGSTTLRVNAVYGLVKMYGIQPYLDAVKAAHDRGYKVHLTIMATPAYYPDMDQKFGYQNLDPTEAKKFSTEMATVLGPYVTRYSIGNEPNHPVFSASTDMGVYDRMFDAAEDGIHAVNPNAEVVAGELAPGNLDEWITNLNDLQGSAGNSIHPYGNEINHLDDYVNQSKVPLYLSEYGNVATDPDQKAHNMDAIKKAKCAGAKLLIMYQLIRTPNKDWNTGVLPENTQ